MNFSTKKIVQNIEIIAELLKNTRTEKGISLKHAAEKLNINEKYLGALESGQIEKLPEGVYRKNFLREYAIFLGINDKKIIDLFSAETIDNKEKVLFSKKVSKFHFFLSLPRFIRGAFIAFIILICVAYLFYYLNRIVEPPTLTITNPEENFITNNNYVYIQGFTEIETELTINEKNVLVSKNGYFSEKINLKNGLNSITITAQKKYSKKNEVTRKIIVNN